jgi:hypothetical protein
MNETRNTICITAPIFTGQIRNPYLHKIQGIVSANRLPERFRFARPDVFSREFKTCNDM